MAANPYSFLDGCLKFLLLEDDPHYQDLILELLEPVRIFSFFKASSGFNALELLNEKKSFHICILDLGISDCNGDEFFILKNYADYIPCIVLTGSSSPSKGAACIRLGAKDVMEKGTSFDFVKFIGSIREHTIRGILSRNYFKKSSETLNNAIDVLMLKHPSTVTEWADYLLITDRQMRNLWHGETGLGAKHILELHQLLFNAFRYYQSILLGESQRNGVDNRFCTFYNNHRREIDELLNSTSLLP